MKRIILAILINSLILGATATASPVHRPGPRCAIPGVHVTSRRGGGHYSVCEFRWSGQVIRVIAARLDDTTTFKPFGRVGRSDIPSRILLRGHAVAGTNGDYVVQKPHPRMTNHLWIRAKRYLESGTQKAIEFVETSQGAWIDRVSKVIKHHPLNAFGGFPQIVNDGKDTGRFTCPPSNCKRSCGRYHCDNSLYHPNPRTVIGVSRGCEDQAMSTTCIGYLVTVDGRQWRWSQGLRFPALGYLMVRLGAWDAMNTDGGGSTEMWMRYPGRHMCQRHLPVGCLLDRPAYRSQRTVVQAIGLVVPS